MDAIGRLTILFAFLVTAVSMPAYAQDIIPTKDDVKVTKRPYSP